MLEQWTGALERDDPKAAYALLSPQVRRELDFETFREQWNRSSAERSIMLESSRRLAAVEARAVTVYEDGTRLQWVQRDKVWKVAGGLPLAQDLSRPESAIAELVASMRRMDRTPLVSILTSEARARIEREWATRSDSIEAALQMPGALTVSEDGKRAALRYGDGALVRLEFVSNEWRVATIE